MISCARTRLCADWRTEGWEDWGGGWFWSRLVPRNCQVRYHNFRLRIVMKVVCCAHLHSYFTLCTRISHDFIRAHRSGGNNFAPFVTCVGHVTNVYVFYSASSWNCTSVHVRVLALRWLPWLVPCLVPYHTRAVLLPTLWSHIDLLWDNCVFCSLCYCMLLQTTGFTAVCWYTFLDLGFTSCFTCFLLTFCSAWCWWLIRSRNTLNVNLHWLPLWHTLTFF